ncbi:MAG TPA: hypothetical protein VLW54_00020 [Candidatus Acidoferrales bacterium]|nr:hypothetical protein [Candidatus Acidoferrales bacterium]
MALALSCLLTLWAGTAAAQTEPQERGQTATEADAYCAGMITNEEIPYDNYVISGPEANPQTIYSQRQYIYISKGSEGGVKVGDEFMVIRPVKDYLHVRVWDQEHILANQMGRQWSDIGRIHVVVVHPKTSIAEISYSCTYMQRGDYVRPVVNYPIPAFKPLKDLDRFAPPNGKTTARVVRAKNYDMMEGRGAVVYANLTGVKPGDYIRFFRYSGARNNSIYQIGGMTDHVFGFGKTPERWAATDVPREVLGEGVVLRVTPTSASVLIFNQFREIYLGDWVEVE